MKVTELVATTLDLDDLAERLKRHHEDPVVVLFAERVLNYIETMGDVDDDTY